MINRFTLATLLLLTVVGFTMAPATARAEHASYCYAGQCHGFAGESCLVDALQHMDNAFLASCHRDRILETVTAKQLVLKSYHKLCDRLARSELLVAVRYLSRYMGTQAQCDLDAASAAIHRALELEGGVHIQAPALPPVVQPPVVHHPVGHRRGVHRPIVAPVVVPTVPAKSYCYTGHCHGFHGESHLIAALKAMDQALIAPCLRTRIEATRHARHEILLARGELCNYEARYELTSAMVDLDRYAVTGRVCELDGAAAHVTRALEIERGIHVHAPAVHGSPFGPAGHGLKFGKGRFTFRINF